EEMIGQFSKFMGELANEREIKISEFNARLNEDRENRQRDQQRLAMSLARFSPATSMSLAMTQLAGTSISMKNRFSDQARDYQAVFRAFLEEKNPGSINMGSGMVMRVTINQGSGNVSVGGADDSKINPSELPVFEYQDVKLGDVSIAAMPDIVFLVGFGILFFVGAFVQFLRFDVR